MRLNDIVIADLAASVSSQLSVSSLYQELCDAPPADAADILLENFVSIALDEDSTSTISNHQVVKIASDGLGTSTKLGNLVINWKNITREAPSFALTGVSSLTDPLVFCLAAVVLVTQLSNHAHIQLTKDHIMIIRFITENSDSSPPSIDLAGFPHTTASFPFDAAEKDILLAKLEEYGIVSIEGTLVTLKERVSLHS